MGKIVLEQGSGIKVVCLESAVPIDELRQENLLSRYALIFHRKSGYLFFFLLLVNDV